METSLAARSDVWNSARGEFISDHHVRLAKALKDYSPTYSLVFNPKGVDIGGEPYNYAILESVPGREPYIVRYLTSEMIKNPKAIIDWVASGDLRRHRASDIVSRMETQDAVEQYQRLKAQEAKADDGNEFVATVVRGGINKLHTFKHNGKKYEV